MVGRQRWLHISGKCDRVARLLNHNFTFRISIVHPWENGYIESFNGKPRDELPNGEIFDTVTEARVITERWKK